MLKQRVITALVLLVVLLPCIFVATPRPFAVLTLVFVAAALWEWARLNRVGAAVNALGQAKLDGMEQAIKAVAAEPGEARQKVLDALGEGNLYVRKSDGQVFIATGSGDSLSLTDPVTGAAAGDAVRSGLSKIKINNALRRQLKAAAGG